MQQYNGHVQYSWMLYAVTFVILSILTCTVTGPRPLQSVTNMTTTTQPPRSTARVPPSKTTIWGQPGLQTQSNTQSRDATSIPEGSWAQQAQQAIGARTTNLDLSSSSFPSLNNSGGQSQAANNASSAWQGGPPQTETSRRQQIGSRTLGSRPGQSADFFPADSRAAVMSNGPPGLVQRPPLNDSSDPSRVTSPSALQQDSRSPIGQTINGAIGQDRPLAESSPASQQPRDPFAPQAAFDQASDQTPESILSGLSEKDKYGMKGYLALAEGTNATTRSLYRGQDLAALGLNMNADSPLLSTYTGPFASPNTHPPRPLDNEYHTPECYTVKKVAPLNQRVNSFSDETLFYMFYSMPRDYMQVLVAQELMERKWRYHIHEQMWMMRDDSVGGYAVSDDKSAEQGYYIWWDKNVWKKVRRAYTLRYADLDDMPNVGGGQGMGRTAVASRSNMGLQAAGPAGGLNGAIGAGPFNAVPGLEKLVGGGRPF